MSQPEGECSNPATRQGFTGRRRAGSCFSPCQAQPGTPSADRRHPRYQHCERELGLDPAQMGVIYGSGFRLGLPTRARALSGGVRFSPSMEWPISGAESSLERGAGQLSRRPRGRYTEFDPAERASIKRSRVQLPAEPPSIASSFPQAQRGNAQHARPPAISHSRIIAMVSLSADQSASDVRRRVKQPSASHATRTAPAP
jgi:hypothetical protein